jgi:hypothetical protein
MSDLSPFEIAHRRLAHLGVRLERLPGEYRVNWVGGKEVEWAYYEDLASATTRGEEMAAERLLKPLGGGRRRRHGKPVYRTQKAYLTAIRKLHNRRLWAGRGKIAPSTRPGEFS